MDFNQLLRLCGVAPSHNLSCRFGIQNRILELWNLRKCFWTSTNYSRSIAGTPKIGIDHPRDPWVEGRNIHPPPGPPWDGVLIVFNDIHEPWE